MHQFHKFGSPRVSRTDKPVTQAAEPPAVETGHSTANVAEEAAAQPPPAVPVAEIVETASQAASAPLLSLVAPEQRPDARPEPAVVNLGGGWQVVHDGESVAVKGGSARQADEGVKVGGRAYYRLARPDVSGVVHVIVAWEAPDTVAEKVEARVAEEMPKEGGTNE